MSDLVFGGPKYMWQGQSIRCIKYDGNIHAVLPRKDSVLSIPVELDRNCYYALTLRAKSNISVGVVVEVMGEKGRVQQSIINLESSQAFSNHIIKFVSSGKGKEKFVIKIRKVKAIQCEIVVNRVSISQTSTIDKPNPAKPTSPEDARSKLNKQIEAGKLQGKIDSEHRTNKLNELLFKQNAGMSVIGGNGYKWKGKNLKIVYKDGVQCVDLVNKESCVFAKASILGGAEYKVTITAEKVGGNGTFFVNFFGGKNVDGTPATITVQGNEFRDHSAVLSSPKFTPGLPIYLRVWRGDNSTGRIIIKAIQYIRVEKPKPVVRPKPAPTKASTSLLPPKQIEASKKPLRAKKERIEDFDMKYKPQDKNSNLSDRVNAVYVQAPTDVPKVSIITPTRDGCELIKKCYAALTENTNYPNWEWIIGDSSSTDGTVEFLRQTQDTRLKIIERGTTDGSFSSINNELVKHAEGEYLLFLNNDTQPQPFWLYNMVAKIHHNPEIGIVGSRLLYSPEKVQHCGIAFIPQGPANIGKSVLKSFPPNYVEHDRFYQAVTAACLMIRRADFDKVGGFGEEYWFCYEDVDLCLKVREQLNKKVLYSSDSMVIHNESITQNKHSTSGTKQQEGIKKFKQRWMSKVSQDFAKYQTAGAKGIYKPEVSFVTCVSNVRQYMTFIIGSLFKNKTMRNYEVIPILNQGNKYSAAKALNLGLAKAKANIVVFCHQDVMFFENWMETLFERIKLIEDRDKNWGVIGTAGITARDDTIGVVTSLKGRIQWQQTNRTLFGAVQTVDEHCMIIRKNSGLKFDEAITGFHLYGSDLCLLALSKGMKNYGILNPLVHASSSASLISGQKDFMIWLNFIAGKWSGRFKIIRTPTSMIKGKTIKTFVKF